MYQLDFFDVYSWMVLWNVVDAIMKNDHTDHVNDGCNEISDVVKTIRNNKYVSTL